MQNNKTTQDDLIMLCAAYLAAMGKKQIEIADTLELSQTTVSRLLKLARRDYLKEELRFLKEKVDQDTYRLILQRTDRKGLGGRLNEVAERAGCKGPVLQVFSSGSKDPADLDRRLAEFSLKAAPYIKNLIVRANSCGLTWGKTLWNVVDALGNLGVPPPWCGHSVSIIPLTGEPLGEMPNAYSSSSLVEDLGKLANGDKQTPALSIGMVPAFAPEGFSKAELDGVRKLIQLVKAYGTIFGDGKSAGLADRLDMILTSVGPAEKPLGFGDGTLLKTGKPTIEELKRLLAGDMGGVCFPRPDLSLEDRQTVEKVNDRWTGVKRKHLEACARRAFKADLGSGVPGVVIVAVGAYKAQFIFEAIKLGMINNLIIDEDLEEQLEHLVEGQFKNTSTHSMSGSL
jgi:DNA-binding transcriptional regulator LsrR (DeoR family)